MTVKHRHPRGALTQRKVEEIIARHLVDEVECNMSWLGEFRKHLDRGELIRYVRHLEEKVYD
jgi:hypothetical protein